MTRARDKLILTAAVDPENTSRSYFYDKLQPILKKEDCPIKVIETSLPAASYTETKAARRSIDSLLAQYLQERNETVRGEVAQQLSAVYPFAEDLSVKSKYSVTELNQHEKESVPVIRLPRYVAPAEEEGAKRTDISDAVTGAALGTVLHTAMEHLPLGQMLNEAGRPGLPDSIEAYLKTLVQDEILTQQEADAGVDPGGDAPEMC